MQAAFHLGPEVEWRWRRPGERIYYHTGEGYVGVWLEHLRTGWNPRCHQFVKHLFKYVYKISIMQLTPNGVKWISWFLSCCDKMCNQPTFRLFHKLFFVMKSNHLPLYELRFWATECGYNSGLSKPVFQQSSLKYWSGELIFLKRLDLEYLPHLALNREIEDFHPPVLIGKALSKIFNFCECLGYHLTRDTFMKHKTIHNHECELFCAL